MFFLNASNISIRLTLPFVGLMLSMAFGPLVAEKIWHRHGGKITSAWAAAFLVPSSIALGVPSTFHAFLQTMLLDYLPFVILLTALFVVSGGIAIVGRFHGTPFFNTVFLAVGALAAGFIGTTGASLLLIRPLIRANSKRACTAHINSRHRESAPRRRQ